jgi:membrane associated rhomboid family serine protease
MRTLRALWHPLTPLALVLVVLPLLTLLAPPQQRSDLMFCVWIGSFVAAWAATRALRSTLDRIPVPEGEDPPFHEVMLERWLRWLLVIACVFGTLAIWRAMIGVQAWKSPPPPGPVQPDSTLLEPYQSIFLALLPLLFFSPFGVQLWVHLASARRRRSQGLQPLPFKPASTTGDERLDGLLRPKRKATIVLGLVAAAGSALGNLLPPTMQVIQTLSKGTGEKALFEPWRFFTASFVHQDVTALVIGLVAFIALAPIVEALLGKGWLVLVVVGGGVVATVMSSILLPQTDFMGLTGVDAALAGLLVFFALLQRHRLPPATVEHVAVRCLTVVVVLAFAAVLVQAADLAAAFGGFGTGMLLAPFARPKGSVKEALEKVRGEALAAG